MKIELVDVSEAEKSVLRQMIELYQYDLSVYTDKDLNDAGYFGYSYLDYYWNEDSRNAYFVRYNGCLCGFVMVSEYCYVLKDSKAKSISEFFIMNKYRRLGIGRKAALEIFKKFPGMWEVNQIINNEVAYTFWETLISAYTQGNYKKTYIDKEDGKMQSIVFSSEKAAEK